MFLLSVSIITSFDCYIVQIDSFLYKNVSSVSAFSVGRAIFS